MEKETLRPAEVFHYFDEICQVPRPSKHEEKIVAYLKEFGAKHQLETKVDAVGNVLIKKPATKGCEKMQGVILQSHIDMVCEKNADVEHDFNVDPIETYVDGDWLRAKGTTLGADNGIGVATELAILASTTIEHGPLECLFTIDEETGLTGAFALKEGFMDGSILINLDSEDEGELFIGCAGGIDTVAKFHYKEEAVPEDYFFFRIDVKGLVGGHSGDDIDKGRANANKLLTRFLLQSMKKYPLSLCKIEGGNLRNAIPREGYAIAAIPATFKEAIRVDFNLFAAAMEKEYAQQEEFMQFVLQSHPTPSPAIEKAVAKKLLLSLHAVVNGVFAMSQEIKDFVQTSNNLASIKMNEPGVITVQTSQRSSVNSSKEDVNASVAAAFELADAEVKSGEGYPGWNPNPDSAILRVAVASYKAVFGVEPEVKAIHAGLECGLFLEKYPSLDMVSFGPTLRGVHSPDERMLIPTVAKFWDHLLHVLKNIPAAK
ncbi:MAG: aminoacyl-histidine dipeptidase [Bacteroidaceae bacterium]